jgi:hypothetical protein
MARLIGEGRERVAERTGKRVGRRGSTWPADLRNAAKDTETPATMDRDVPGPRRRPPGTVKREPAREVQEALF